MYIMHRKFRVKFNSWEARQEFNRMIQKYKGFKCTYILDTYDAYVYTNLSYRFKLGSLPEKFCILCIKWLAWCCNVTNKTESSH